MYKKREGPSNGWPLPTLFLSLVSSLSLHDGLRSCRSVESPVRLAFDAIEEVEPEVTAAAAAAIEVDVGKAVMDDAAEDDPGIQNNVLKFVQLITFTLFSTCYLTKTQ